MLAPGTRLGGYEVDSLLGEGGMGTVYRARDTKLQRQVAIKVLRSEVAGDPDRLARFRREARVLAALNHPNIAAIYGLEDHEGMPFLVLELVDGDTLAERIAAGPVPVDDALPIARQMADALEAAHELGIVHRDLKPANVKLTPAGTVKVLDFGLAKAYSGESVGVSSTDLSNSPTLTAQRTEPGIILGTAAYMSPEQVRGKQVDKRADVWAFGVVLFEMLTGHRLFAGDTVSDTLAAVLTQEPDWSGLPKNVPWRAAELLRSCLEKDPRSRVRDIGDARLQLEATRLAGDRASALTQPHEKRWHSSWLLAAGVVLGLVTAGLIAWQTFLRLNAAGNGQSTTISRFSIPLPLQAPFFVENYPNACLAISRDGSRIAYCSRDDTRRLYLRELNSLDVRPIPGTEGGVQPFFSPDGQSLAFFTRDGALKRVSLAGGQPLTLARDLPYSSFVLGTWTDDGRIVFDTWNSGLRVVSEDGGPVTTVTSPDAEWHQDPQALPGSPIVIYSVLSQASLRLEAKSFDGAVPKPILENASHGRYLASGHLLFVRDGALMVAPFDNDALQVTGPAVSVSLGVAVDNPAVRAPAPQLAVSQSGTLVYAPTSTGSSTATFVWVDRGGGATEIGAIPLIAPFVFQLAPDRKAAGAGKPPGPIGPHPDARRGNAGTDPRCGCASRLPRQCRVVVRRTASVLLQLRNAPRRAPRAKYRRKPTARTPDRDARHVHVPVLDFSRWTFPVVCPHVQSGIAGHLVS
ncbi:MAG: protein kinase domain-containing protein [Vicinamibacterales bacterium]